MRAKGFPFILKRMQAPFIAADAVRSPRLPVYQLPVVRSDVQRAFIRAHDKVLKRVRCLYGFLDHVG